MRCVSALLCVCLSVSLADKTTMYIDNNNFLVYSCDDTPSPQYAGEVKNAKAVDGQLVVIPNKAEKDLAGEKCALPTTGESTMKQITKKYFSLIIPDDNTMVEGYTAGMKKTSEAIYTQYDGYDNKGTVSEGCYYPFLIQWRAVDWRERGNNDSVYQLLRTANYRDFYVADRTGKSTPYGAFYFDNSEDAEIAGDNVPGFSPYARSLGFISLLSFRTQYAWGDHQTGDILVVSLVFTSVFLVLFVVMGINKCQPFFGNQPDFDPYRRRRRAFRWLLYLASAVYISVFFTVVGLGAIGCSSEHAPVYLFYALFIYILLPGSAIGICMAVDHQVRKRTLAGDYEMLEDWQSVLASLYVLGVMLINVFLGWEIIIHIPFMFLISLFCLFFGKTIGKQIIHIEDNPVSGNKFPSIGKV